MFPRRLALLAPDLGQTLPTGKAGRYANGSGCVPLLLGTTVLPDGIWFGYARDVIHQPGDEGQIEFDLACFYEGSAANAEAAHDERVPDSGIYVRNESPLIFTRAVIPGAPVFWLDSELTHGEASFDEWPGALTNPGIECPGPSAGCGSR